VTWFKVDDSLPDHPKILRLQAHRNWQDALALWTLAGAWAARHLTDGVVPSAIVGRLGCAQRDADLLVKVGLWDRTEDGFVFHSWTKRNPTRVVVEAKREKTRNKVSTWRSNQPCNPVTDEVTDEGSNGPRNPAPVPSRPIRSGESLTTFEISSGVRACEEGPSAGQVQTRFKALFEARFDVSPYMGGGQVIANFPQRLRETAARKNLDALELLGVTFAAWAAKPLDEISQNAPYAAFAARFGSLCGAKGANGGPSELDELHAAQTAALAARDMVRYESLVAEEKRRAGGSR